MKKNRDAKSSADFLRNRKIQREVHRLKSNFKCFSIPGIVNEALELNLSGFSSQKWIWNVALIPVNYARSGVSKSLSLKLKEFSLSTTKVVYNHICVRACYRIGKSLFSPVDKSVTVLTMVTWKRRYERCCWRTSPPKLKPGLIEHITLIFSCHCLAPPPPRLNPNTFAYRWQIVRFQPRKNHGWAAAPLYQKRQLRHSGVPWPEIALCECYVLENETVK